MAIILMTVAGILTALSNLCMRLSMDTSGSSRAFMVLQLLFTFIVVTILFPFRSGIYHWNPVMIALAILGGIALGLMKVAVGKAVEKGPSGLVFAVVNCACIIPSIFVFTFLSNVIDCTYTLWNALGSMIVLCGLIWAGRSDASDSSSVKNWVFFALAAFLLHVFYLISTELRLYLMGIGYLDTQWFVPGVFVAATTMHLCIFMIKEQESPSTEVLSLGTLGGIFNGVCTYFFVIATEVATPWEQPLIFPVFSVALIAACNLWSQYLYKEKVNWYANAACLAGLALGTI